MKRVLGFFIVCCALCLMGCEAAVTPTPSPTATPTPTAAPTPTPEPTPTPVALALPDGPYVCCEWKNVAGPYIMSNFFPKYALSSFLPGGFGIEPYDITTDPAYADAIYCIQFSIDSSRSPRTYGEALENIHTRLEELGIYAETIYPDEDRPTILACMTQPQLQALLETERARGEWMQQQEEAYIAAHGEEGAAEYVTDLAYEVYGDYCPDPFVTDYGVCVQLHMGRPPRLPGYSEKLDGLLTRWLAEAGETDTLEVYVSKRGYDNPLMPYVKERKTCTKSEVLALAESDLVAYVYAVWTGGNTRQIYLVE